MRNAGFVLFAALLAGEAFAAAAPATPLALIDSLAASPSPAHTERIAAWARTAPLDPLLWVLRRGRALGGAERPLTEAALARTGPARAELRRRLQARLALLDPRLAKKSGRDLADLEASRPRQSVYRVALILPTRGDYAGYAGSVQAAFAAGLAWARPASALPIEVEFHGTGDDEPARAIAAVDSAAGECGAVVGELLSGPTFALAAATRYLGLPLISPTATDESIGRSGPAVFQVGPASEARGRRLARVLLAEHPRKIALMVSADAAPGFADAFAAEAESLGSTIVRRERVLGGATDFRTITRGLRTFGADVLLWDGETHEAEALVRTLAAEGISVKLCGGASLAPDQFHASTRALLEGVTYVADDFKLGAAEQDAVDSLAHARGEKAGALWTRGFLAGRRLAAAVDEGARTPAELTAHLRHPDARMRAAGFLDAPRDGATLPVYTVTRGKPVEIGR